VCCRHQRLVREPSGSAPEVAYGDQVALADCPNVKVVQGDQRLRPARRQDELDLETVRWMEFDDRAKIATAQTMFGEVPIQDDGVE